MKDENIIEMVTKHTREHGFPPRYSEIADGLGVSKTTAWRRVRALIDEGLLEQAPGCPRTLRVKGVMKARDYGQF